MAEAHIEYDNHVPAIYGAMLKVQQGIANIPKNGEMKFGGTNYKYLKADDVQEKLNPLLSENGIVVNSQYNVRDAEKGNRHWVYVDLALTYISTEDGSKFPPVLATGEAIAGDDKSVNKALTQAIKNAHRASFQFASGEPEPEDAPSATTTAPPANRALDNARRGPAKAPGKPAGNSAQETIKKDYIDSGKVDKDYVNEIYRQAKESGKTGTALWDSVLETLKAGE